MSDHQSPIADPSSARRRLLKGSFAVPAALTLASGTAFAAGSAGMRCVNNSSTAPNNQPAPGPTDTLIRVRAWTSLSGADAYVFVRGDDIVAKLGTSSGQMLLKDRNGVSVGVNDVLCVVGQTNTTPQYVANTSYPAASAIPGSTGTAAYYAILIDTNGNIVGISTVSTVAGGAVSNNCWRSFGGAGVI